MSQVVSSMAGNLWKLLVGVGDDVTEGQDVAILESMKMEIPIVSEVRGKVKAVITGEGEFVNEGDVILEIE
jgi:acetyl-CoA carboxylase biotin carboxyl carrier protein